MENLLWQQPGFLGTTVRAVNGSTSYSEVPSSLRQISRSQQSYRGPRVETRGPLPIHTYQLVVQEYGFNLDFDDRRYDDGSGYYRTGPFLTREIVGAAFPTPDHGRDLYLDALEKLNEKVRGGLDLSVDLAEAGQTIKMMNLKDKIVDYTKTFTKRKFGKIKSIANPWLEYTYGVKPLVSSLYGVTDEMLRHVMNKLSRVSARSTVLYTPKTAQLKTLDGWINIPVVGGQTKASVTLGVDLHTPDFDLARWTSLNPVSLAWELMPYSFVVDWFYNVGGYLRNMETYLLYNSKFRQGYRTDFTKHDLKLEIAKSNLRGVNYTQSYLYRGFAKSLSIHRLELTSYPLPHLPSFKADLGSSRLLSGAALLAQFLGRR